MVVEYRNDLDGGLDTSFDITEFGVWAQVGSGAEVLLLRGDLSDNPHPIKAYVSGEGVEIQRFPLTIGVSGECPVVLGYSALAFMTAEDVTDYCMTAVLPLFLEQVQDRIAAHNADPTAHLHLRTYMDDLAGRLSMLELQYATGVTGNPWQVDFLDLTGLSVTGVWTKPRRD